MSPVICDCECLVGDSSRVYVGLVRSIIFYVRVGKGAGRTVEGAE